MKYHYLEMVSDFGTQTALDKKVKKAYGVKEEFPRNVSAQNTAKEGPVKVIIIGGGHVACQLPQKLEDIVILR